MPQIARPFYSPGGTAEMPAWDKLRARSRFVHSYIFFFIWLTSTRFGQRLIAKRVLISEENGKNVEVQLIGDQAIKDPHHCLGCHHCRRLHQLRRDTLDQWLHRLFTQFSHFRLEFHRRRCLRDRCLQGREGGNKRKHFSERFKPCSQLNPANISTNITMMNADERTRQKNRHLEFSREQLRGAKAFQLKCLCTTYPT